MTCKDVNAIRDILHYCVMRNFVWSLVLTFFINPPKCDNKDKYPRVNNPSITRAYHDPEDFFNSIAVGLVGGRRKGDAAHCFF